MYGELIHTEHCIETVSEFYFDATKSIITELKNLTDNRVKLYNYSISEFKTIYNNSSVNKCFFRLN